MYKIEKNIKVPTGNICVLKTPKGQLEFLSIGDYGKMANVKAQFLGLNEELNGVPNGKTEPLEEKWVVTISTQYGCPQKCKFCDVPLIGFKGNASYDDLKAQVIDAIGLHPEVKTTKRLNIHYARMGEPSWNQNVIDFSKDLLRVVREETHIGRVLIHPVFTTMLPKNNKNLIKILNEWTIDIMQDTFKGNAGLQFSINSTSNEQRDEMFDGRSLSLDEISEIGKSLPMPKGRKYALNFALADGYEVDAKRLLELFSPDKFMVKITPIHKTHSTVNNDIKTTDGYEFFTPYKQVEKDLIEVGFDVLIFVPSYDEDLGKITCGNAILSGNMPECKYEIVK